MKKVMIIISFLLLLIANYIVVYAGDLNQYESEVVNVAKGTFEVDGVTYQVKQTYINELIRYFMEDNVDITAKQRDEAISIMHANVNQGVDEGYLIPITEHNNIEEQTSKSQIINRTDNEEEKMNTITDDKTEEFIHQIMNESNTTTKLDVEKGKVTVTKGEDDSLITVNTVIKNTGFNLNATVIMAFIIFTVMVICMFITYKLKLLVHEEEKYKYEK